MTALQQVSPLPVSFDAYVRHGWVLVPIPPGTKGPNAKGWNQKQNCITDVQSIPATSTGYGVGLAHAYSGTMALDIDDWERAVEIFKTEGIDLLALFNAPDAVIVTSGKRGHGKLIYQMPLGMTFPTKQVKVREGDKTITVYELRCASSNGTTVQDVLPPSLHPETNKPYQWAGNGHWQRLPIIPSDLLTLWESKVSKDREAIKVEGSKVDASWEEITNALDHINPDCSREDWLSVGMALHFAGTQTDQVEQAIAVWDSWSSKGEKYKGQKDITACWRSFKPDGGITLGTLFHLATEGGYTRPMPDVSHLFTNVEIVKGASIVEGLITPPPKFNMDHVPELLAKRADELSRSMGSDPLIPLFAGFAAVSAAVDARTRIRLTNTWKMPPILWLMTIGSSSTKKTPASGPMLQILKKLEAEDRPRYEAEKVRFEALDTAYAASKKAYLAAAGTPEFALNPDVADLPVILPQPAIPVDLCFMVDDINSQKTTRMAAVRSEGILCYMDEMKSWAERLNDPRTGENRSMWVRGYNGESARVDRVGDGTIIIDHFALSIAGNLQPKVLRANIEALGTDGLLQRFIFAILRDEYTELLDDPTVPITTTEAWESLIRKIHALPETEYTLSDAAYGAFRAFQEWLIALRKDERLIGASEVYREALGKIDGLTGRLILIYHLITDPYSPNVPEGTAQQAIRLVQTYIVPAMRYTLSDIAGIEVGSLDHWLAEHISYLSADHQTVTLSEIKRSARRQIDKAKHSQHLADVLILDGMAMLEQAGWVALIESNKKTTSWAINPALNESDPQFRQEVVKAKQRIYDHIHETSGGKATRRIVK